MLELLTSSLIARVAHTTGKRPTMEHTSDGFERIAMALMEMQQGVQVLIAENRHLQAELAALRLGAGRRGDEPLPAGRREWQLMTRARRANPEAGRAGPLGWAAWPGVLPA